MKLKVLLPTEILVEAEVNKISAEAPNGAFGMLPEHIDFVTALAPGILFYESQQGEEVFLAIDEGILVKCGAEVLVSTRQAIRGTDLENLHQTVEEQFSSWNEQQKITRSSLAKLEAGFVRGVSQLGE